MSQTKQSFYNDARAVGTVAGHLPFGNRLAMRLVSGLWNEAMCASVERIKFKNAARAGALQRLVDSFPALRALDLSGSKGASAEALSHLVRLPALVALTLSNTDVGDDGLAEVSRLSGLASLELALCGNVTDIGLEAVCKLASLQALDLDGASKLTAAGLERLLGGLSRLVSLQLPGSGPTPAAVFATVRRLPALVSLAATFAQLSDEAFDHIAAMPAVTALNLSGCDVTDSGLAKVCALTRVTSLNVSSCGLLTNAGLGHVAQLTGLTSLEMNWCPNIDDEGLAKLRHLRSLKSVSLAGCESVTDDGLAKTGRTGNMLLYASGRVVFPSARRRPVSRRLSRMACSDGIAKAAKTRSARISMVRATRPVFGESSAVAVAAAASASSIASAGGEASERDKSPGPLALDEATLSSTWTEPEGRVAHYSEPKTFVEIPSVARAIVEHLLPPEQLRLRFVSRCWNEAVRSATRHVKCKPCVTDAQLRSIPRSFTHIDALELCLPVRNVGTALAAVASGFSTLTSLELAERVDEAPSCLYDRHYQTKELPRTAMRISLNDGVWSLRRFSTLATLSLRGTALCTSVVLANVGQSLPWLTSLSLKDSSVDDAGLKCCLLQLQQLTSLALCVCFGITDAAIAAAVDGLPELQRLTLEQCDGITNRTIEYAGRSRGLVSLRVPSCKGITNDGLLRSARLLRGLTELDLTATLVSDAGLDGVSTLVRLTSLTLVDCDVSDEGLVHLRRMTALQTVNLVGCGSITEGGLECLSELSGLTSLRLSCRKPIKASGLASMCKLPRVASLVVRFSTITASGQPGRQRQGMTSLTLDSCCSLGDDALAVVGNLASLESLSLVACDAITNEGVKALVRLPRLRSLQLRNCDEVTDQGLAHVAAVDSLTTLVIGGRIGDAALECVSHMTGLTALDVSRCAKATSTGLAKHLPSLTQLRVVDLERGKAESVVDVLREAIPGVNIRFVECK